MDFPAVLRRTLSSREWMLLLIFVAVSLVLKGSSLIALTYQTDDYVAFAPAANEWEHFRWMMAQGRFASAFLICAASQLGIASPGSCGLYGLLLVLAQVLFGLGVCRVWRVESPFASALVIGMICFHPYQAELFAYKMGYGFYMPAFLFGALALIIPVAGRRTQIAACLLIAAAIASFQVILHYLAAALIFAVILDWIRDGSLTLKSFWQTFVRSESRLRITALVLGVVTYVLAGFLLSVAFGIAPEGRFKLLTIADLPDRMRNIYHFVKFLALNDSLVPPATRILFVVLLAASVLSLPLNRTRLIPYIWLVAALLGALAASVLIPLVIRVWDLNPRTTSALGVWWAGILFIGVYHSKLAPFVRVLAVLILLSCAGITNHVLLDQQRLNLRDELLANRIIARLETHSGYEQVKKLVFIGGERGYELPIATAQASLNISAFGEAWSRVGIFREITGRDFQAGDAADDETARALEANLQPWPSANSILIQNDLAIIYLPKLRQ